MEYLLLSKSNLSKGGRRCSTGAVAVEGAAAVTGGASAFACGVKRAPVPAPDPTRPPRREIQSKGLVRVELETPPG